MHQSVHLPRFILVTLWNGSLKRRVLPRSRKQFSGQDLRVLNMDGGGLVICRERTYCVISRTQVTNFLNCGSLESLSDLIDILVSATIVGSLPTVSLVLRFLQRLIKDTRVYVIRFQLQNFTLGGFTFVRRNLHSKNWHSKPLLRSCTALLFLLRILHLRNYWFHICIVPQLYWSLASWIKDHMIHALVTVVSHSKPRNSPSHIGHCGKPQHTTACSLWTSWFFQVILHLRKRARALCTKYPMIPRLTLTHGHGS